MPNPSFSLVNPTAPALCKRKDLSVLRAGKSMWTHLPSQIQLTLYGWISTNLAYSSLFFFSQKPLALFHKFNSKSLMAEKNLSGFGIKVRSERMAETWEQVLEWNGAVCRLAEAPRFHIPRLISLVSVKAKEQQQTWDERGRGPDS